MKKTLRYILLLTALLTASAGCVKEELGHRERTQESEEIPYPSEGKALVTFTVAVPGVADTKAAMADTPTIENMRVVVFGSSGYLKESVDIDDFQPATTNGSETLYTFKAKLSLTDSKNLRVHVIANLGDVKLPWRYDSEVMTRYAYTSDNQDAYWAYFTLPNGITLKKEYDPTPEVESMVYVKDKDGYYQVTDEVTDAFCGGTGHPGLPLVRNFAKISVQSTTPQFILSTDKTFAIINRPDRGSVAPYNPDNGNFILGYKDYEYKTLKSEYPGFSPNETQYLDSDPDASSVMWGSGTGTGEGVESTLYMYERPIPSDGEPASYMIVHGTFYPFNTRYFDENQPKNWKTAERETPGTYLDLSAGVPCYYKVDFKDDEGSYAIFRNFRYKIRITNVAKAGAETAGAAGSTGGTGSIDQDTSISGLTDISDGYGRIAVSHTGWTFVDSRAEFELKYKFIQDVTGGDDTANNALVEEGGYVTITVGEKTGPVNVITETLDSSISGEGTVLDFGGNGEIKVMGASNAKDAEGFRTIKFTVNSPDGSDKTTQTIHISGQIDASRTISRDVVYYLMPRQTMIVECVADQVNPDYGSDYVEDVAGEGVNVKITIPKMLPESMFPLEFALESDALSITPNTAKYPEDNLPVANGNSICEGKTSSKTFHYVRTLTYSEYEDLTETLDGMEFFCHFKTNKAASASTIYVANEYFNLGHAEFKNYSMYDFKNLSFSNNSAAANTNVNFTFYLDDEDTNTSGRDVQVKLDGLVPQTGAALIPDPEQDDVYTYFVSAGSKSATLALKTTTATQGFDNTYAVTLNAYSGGKTLYHEASHGNVAQRISVSPTSYTLHAGETKTLTATVWPASIGTGSVSWTSSNTSVATVDSNGKVTAVAVGTAQITASHSGMSASCTITVEPIEVKRITLDKTSLRIDVGNTSTLVATVTPTNATDKTVTWSSSDPSVATVSSTGVVRGVAYGTATITATSSNGLTATCTVNVVEKPVTGVTLNRTSLTLAIISGTGQTQQLTATITPTNALNKNVTWTSSNPSVATVSSTGLVTAVAKGTTTITVTTADGGYTATCAVKVGVQNSKTFTTTSSTVNNTGTRTLTDSPVTVSLNVRNRNINYLELERTTPITVDAGDCTITRIVINLNNNGGALTPSSGSVASSGSGTNYVRTWTGEASNVTFTQGNTTRMQSKSIVVTYLEF